MLNFKINTIVYIFRGHKMDVKKEVDEVYSGLSQHLTEVKN